MKYLFAVIAVLLLAASAFVWAAMPGVRSDRQALIYWTTDANPARAEQVRLFDDWQRRVGLVDEQGVPLVALELDTGNSEPTKKIIQSVSGVAGDTMDLFNGRDMHFFAAMDVLVDVTEYGEALGYSPDTTYPALVPEITVVSNEGEQRQFMYPCNVALLALMVNKPMFRELGLEPPSGQWTIEEFEEIGKEFVARANPEDRSVGRVFFVDTLEFQDLRRSFGVDRFNETLTDTNIDAPEAIEALELLRKWIVEDRLIPTTADRDSFATSGGYGGGPAELFERGVFGMFRGGRWILIRFRQTNIGRVAQGLPPLELGTVELPNAGHRTSPIGTRAAALYVDGERMRESVTLKDGTVLEEGTPWAVVFQAFLASPEYNGQIIADADGLPGNPVYTRSDAFLRPEPDPELGIYPATEYEIHGPHLEIATTIADPETYSPFVLAADVIRDENQQRDAYLTIPPLQPTAAAAMQEAARRIRNRIAANLEARPELRDEYERRLVDQQRIDELKAAGQPIPEELVRNPFYLRYYRERGMLLERDPDAMAPGGPREITADKAPVGQTPEGDPIEGEAETETRDALPESLE